MEIDLYVPSFRTASKRIRSRSPTSCEQDRPLVCVVVFRFYSSVPTFVCNSGRNANSRQHSPLVTIYATRHYLSNPHLRVLSRSPLSWSFKSPHNRCVFPLQMQMQVSRMSSGSPSHATLPSFLLNILPSTTLPGVATRKLRWYAF